MTKSQLNKEIQELKSNFSKYTKYKVTADFDNCNSGIICININYYNSETDEYLDSIEFKAFGYSNDEEYSKAHNKAEKEYIKLEELVKELNVKESLQ